MLSGFELYPRWVPLIKTAAAFADGLAPKKGALFSLIYFFRSLCVYYIPQAMPHARVVIVATELRPF